MNTGIDLKLKEKSLLKRPWLLISMGISLVCAVVLMLSFNYEDGEFTRDWSMQLLDCVFGKTDMEFYHYSESVMAYECCDKTILMMIPISIWNLPVWILHEITKSEFLVGFGGIVWMKIGYLLCVILISVVCARIVKIVNPEADCLLAIPLLIGSFDVLNSTMYACQDEIVYVLMLVIALKKLIEGKNKLFLVFATITVSLNPEMIIPVVLMILFKEKRILYALGSIVITYLPSGLFSVVYGSNDVYSKYTWIDKASGMMGDLFTTDIALSQKDGNVSLFLVTICVLLFFSFTQRQKESDPLTVIWITGAAMTSMTLLSSGSFMNYFYRSFLYVPFLLLICLTAKKNLHTNLILYALFSWARGWLDLLTCSIQNISSPYLTINTEFTRRVFDKSRIVSPGRFISKEIPLLSNFGLITAACLALAIVLFYINFKDNQNKTYELLTSPRKMDVFVVITGLFVPAVLGLFAYSMIKSDHYDKTIQFGSLHIEDYYEEAVGYDYQNNNGIYDFSDNIAYEDNICLMNGADINGVRTIFENGSSFGPYINLYPGSYQIVIEGNGLEGVSYDCTYNDSGIPYPVPMEVETAGNELIIYRINLDSYTQNVELRFFNNASENAELQSIHIEEITNVD